MKAQKTIDISVPKGDGTVTVTMTSDKFSFKEDNYPTYVPNNAVSHKFGTKSVIYTIKQNKDNPVKFEIITKANAWGNLSIKLDGKVIGTETIYVKKDDDMANDKKNKSFWEKLLDIIIFWR